MKNFSKLALALAVALVMSLGIAFPAMADEPTLPYPGTGPGEVSINKVINTPAGTTTPATTFDFTINQIVGGETSGNWVYAASATAITVPTRTIDIAAGGTTGDVGNIFAGVTWPHAGDFVFVVREVEDTNAPVAGEHMTYADDFFVVIVRVANDSAAPSGLAPRATVIFDNAQFAGGTYSWSQGDPNWTDAWPAPDDDGEPAANPGKVDNITFVNDFWRETGTDDNPALTISKTVTGGTANLHTLYFDFDLVVTLPELAVGEFSNTTTATIVGAGNVLAPSTLERPNPVIIT
ncbi:MAG: hypothetical protein FWD93_02780, partial [Coriobacteriia bacterium]|nr:hypothetical protein [Coriobacteriia bacterium]